MTVLARRHLLLAAAGLLALRAGPLRAQGRGDAPLPAARALDAELALALGAGKPLVVMVSLHGCPYCRQVRRSHLAPLLAAGQPVVQVDMDSDAPLRDAVGAATTHGALARAWGVRLAPTLLFLGRGGREAAPRLEGAGLPDFYAAYLDERLRQAARGLG